VLAADMVAGSGAELTGVAVAGVLVGALGVPWAITLLGLGVATAATALAGADVRERRRTAASVDSPAGALQGAGVAAD
jgi:hypothetical protein